MLAALCFTLSPNAAQAESPCTASAVNCRALIQPGCRHLLGESAARLAQDPICQAQILDYRQCLVAVTSNCAQTPAPGARAVASQPQNMLAVWAEVKDSGDANALESFARKFRGAPLATLAAARARSIREKNRRAKLARDAQAVWKHIKNSDNPDALETFAKVFQGHELANEALAQASNLRNPPAPLANAARWRSGPTVTDQPLLNREPDYESALAEAEAKARAARNRAAQTELNRLGYDAGPVDGSLGPRTRKALSAFQQEQGQKPDGRITRATLSALRAAPTPPAEQETQAKPEQQMDFRPTPRSEAAKSAPTTDQLRARISWTILRGNEKIQNSCQTTLVASGPADDEGVRVYEGEEQRCQAADITYKLSVNGASSFITGSIQVLTYNARTRPTQIRGHYPTLKTFFGGAYLTVNLSPPSS